MNNYVQPGETLPLLAPYDVVAGEGAKVGSIFGVAVNDALSGAHVELMTEGVFDLEKTSAQAWAVGERVYWNDSTKKCDTDSAAGMLVGYATAIAANPTATGFVKLVGTATDSLEGAQAAVADVATADADGTYGAPEASLINELKTQLNSLLARLRLAGVIDP